MPGKIQILFFQSFDDYAVINAKVIEKPGPDLNMVYYEPVSGNEWQVINFGFQPPSSMKQGILAMSVKPLHHSAPLEEGQILLRAH
jgi:hypothetical protein